MWQQQQQRPDFLPPDLGPEWLQAGYYQNIPHGEVNWAQLAQHWIAMRQVEEHQNVQRQLQMMQQQQQQQEQQQQQQQQMMMLQNRINLQQHMASMVQQSIQPPLPPMPPLPPNNPPFQFQSMPRAPLLTHPPSFTTEMNVLFPSGQSALGRFAPPPSSSSSTAGSLHPPAYPPRFANNPPMGQQQRPQQHPQSMAQQQMHQQSMIQQQQMHLQAMAPSLITSDFHPPHGFDSTPMPTGQQDVDFRSMWPIAAQMLRDDSSTSPESSAIDLQMRKQLPAWLREGLEKMEREKRKQHQTEDDAEDKSTTATAGVARVPKWRLEETEGASDNEQNQAESDAEGRSDKNDDGAGGDSTADQSDDGERKRITESDYDNEAEESGVVNTEEFREQLLIKLRYWMTSILLEVTSEQITDVVRTFYNSTRASAQPKVLAKSSALASISSLFDDEDERDETNSASDAEQNEEPTEEKDEKGERFKVPMLPISLISSVSKRKSTPVVSDAKSDTAVGITSEDAPVEKMDPVPDPVAKNTIEEETKVSPTRKTESAEKKERKSSSRRDEDSKSKKEHRRRYRSRSRSKSKSKSSGGERRRKSRHRSERSSSKERSSSSSRRKEEKEKRKTSRDDESPKRGESSKRKHRSRSPNRHRH